MYKNEVHHSGRDREKSDANAAGWNRVRLFAFVKGRRVGSIKVGILMANDLLLSDTGQFAADPSFTSVFSNFYPQNCGVP